MLDAMAGYDPSDPKTALSVGRIPSTYTNALKTGGLRGLRIGVLQTLFGTEDKNKPVNTVMSKAIDVMKKQGAIIIDVQNPKLFTDMLSKKNDVQKLEYRQMINDYPAAQDNHVLVHSLQEIITSGDYNKATLQNFLIAAEKEKDGINKAAYWQKITRIRDLKIELANSMAKNHLDVLVYPEQRQLVAPISKHKQPQRNGILGALTGFPVITVPAGFSKSSKDAPIGVPVGMSILGRPWSESLLIRTAYSVEQTAHARKLPQSTPPLPKAY